jgi:Fe-S-cluster containining protein
MTSKGTSVNARDSFERTVCGCQQCCVGCKTMPGYLAVGDLSAIVTALEPAEPRLFVLQNFVASEGAKVGRWTENGKMETFQIPTISPAQKANGRCVFLTDDDKCSIHAVAPFGCSMADSHMERSEGDRRSSAALHEIHADKLCAGPYARTWAMLGDAGKVAKPRAVRRAAFEEAYALEACYNRRT